MTARFCVAPGRIKSQNDGDIHYIGVGQLVRLYKLKPGQWKRHNYPGLCKDLIHLGPSYTYFDANERYPE